VGLGFEDGLVVVASSGYCATLVFISLAEDCFKRPFCLLLFGMGWTVEGNMQRSFPCLQILVLVLCGVRTKPAPDQLQNHVP
jgi:hypothetical protein